MDSTLKVLMAEDSSTDIELIQRELRRGGLDFIAEVVETRDQFMDGLLRFKPDIILCDHSMPQFDSMTALQLAKDVNYNGVFILLTGAVSEEYAVNSIKEGADDYILKRNLTRLVPSIQHALKTVEAEKEKALVLKKLIQSEEQIRNFAGHLNDVMEEERAHIAREIHDELGQQLAGIRIGISILRTELSGITPGTDGKLQRIIGEIDDTIQTMRKIATQLRPAILDSLGLLPSIEWLASEFQKKSGISCIAEIPKEEFVFADRIATCVFRICQESLTNISKHAKASKVRIRFRTEGDHFIISIEDNGVGINSETIRNPFSMGLLGMRERAHAIGSELNLESAAGNGTKVILKIMNNAALPSVNGNTRAASDTLKN